MATMVDLDCSIRSPYCFNFETRSLKGLRLMEISSGRVFNNPNITEQSNTTKIWPSFYNVSEVTLTENFLFVRFDFSSVNVKTTGVSKLFCEHINLTWEHGCNIPSKPIWVSATVYPHTFSKTQVVTICLGLLVNSLWFTFTHAKTGGGASFAILNKGGIIWCAPTWSTGKCLFDRCCHSTEGFKE